MSNGSWRDRPILRLYFWGRVVRPRNREKSPARSEPEILPVACLDHRQARVRVGKPFRRTLLRALGDFGLGRYGNRAFTTCAVSSWESEELDERPDALLLTAARKSPGSC